MSGAQMPATAALATGLQRQRADFLQEGGGDARTRRDRLDRAVDLLVAHQQDFCEAAAADFGQRPAAVTRFMDIMPAVHALKLARRQVRAWMRPRPQRVSLPAGAPGTRAAIRYQPLGVVGLISPWNFPLTLSFGPLAGILAAGNRCLIKPSELTPAVSTLMQRLVAQRFDARELAVVVGGPEVAEAFARLPFDHLLFTGSTAVGRRVMAAAADNLVPVTLELGGKCPVVVGRSADLERVVDRVLMGKLANAGQMCIAPDYLWLPCEALQEFVQRARAWVRRAYPGMPGNADYTAMLSERHLQRMQTLLADAASRGARVVELGAGSAPAGSRLLAPALIVGATDAMQVMQEEIFGPLLPLCTYEHVEQALAAINARPRPLALYYFGHDRAEESQVIARTTSGGVTINDVAMHFLAEELPFGGVGASGIGAYHGEHGFRRFSHARAIFRQTRLDVAGIVGLRPPYGARLRRSLRWLIRR
jgi:coniferyl-aldehyde dehydrogenase